MCSTDHMQVARLGLYVGNRPVMTEMLMEALSSIGGDIITL